jgi:uncharacterized protein (TIGR02172 family)
VEKLDAPIAVGFTAEIYAWRDGFVLKLFKQGRSRKSVEYEAHLSRIVHATGLPVPGVGDIVEVEGRYGLELERVDGPSMLEVLMRKPWMVPKYARQLAELQAEMHTRQVPELPSQNEMLVHKITQAERLPEDVRQAALSAVNKFPVEDKLCHGDFHPGNILLTRRGPVIIDWIDASRGSPVMDVARSSLLFGGGRIPSSIPRAWLVNLFQKPLYNTYLRRYFQLNPLDRQQLDRYIPVAAAARIDENIYFDETRLLAIAQSVLLQVDE